ncbi:MAG: signal peptide peptidase SppA [Cytophagales bacterium]|nr:signal peptide peptidase SppA [Cytophagales bacterium]
MWKFIKMTAAMFLALVLFVTIGILVVAGIVGAATQGSTVTIEDNSVLHILLNQPIYEKEEENPLSEIDVPFNNQRSGHGLIELKNNINKASKDPKIKGIYINVREIDAGLAIVEELRNAILEFKKSKKFVYAYSETFSEKSYYLVSACDKIYLNPVGLIEFNGLQYSSLFIKGALDKLEVQPQVFKAGNYKSAVEPFLRDNMSEYSRQQSLAFIQSINNYYLTNVAKARKIPVERAKIIQDSMLVRNADDALKYKLVDKLCYYDEVYELLKIKCGKKADEKLTLVSYKKYKQYAAPEEQKKESENKIAVIVAEGDINVGKSDDETIGSDDMSEDIRKARTDDKVKAIVLRINSPGGSALASDVMWREVVLAAKKKPIIASMSDVAASGGYYLAMGCTKIVAQPNSITGSIGVFGLFFNVKNFFKNKLGVTYDGVKTGHFSDVGSAMREPTEYEKKAIQSEVDITYDIFVTKAAKGRKKSKDELYALASGRIYSGIDAKANGLVDDLGGLDKAVALAAKAAKLGTDYEINYSTGKKDFFEKIMETLSARMHTSGMEMMPAELINPVKHVLKLKQMEGIQARAPFEMVVE